MTVRAARASPDRVTEEDARADLLAVAAAGVLVVVAAAVGGWLVGRGVTVHAGAAPLFAHVDPALGVGTALAVALAALIVVFAPRVGATWAWGPLLALSGVTTLAWTAALALTRGPAGLLEPLSTRAEYLSDIGRIEHEASLHAWLSGFAASIPATAPHPWTTHVSGHPPGLTLVFVLLDRAGAGGAGPAAAVCLLGWVTAVVAVAATVRRVAGEPTARAALPYLVTLPAVVWAGVSADALPAGLGALGIYLLARGGRWTLLAGGVALGLCCLLSYGAGLLAFPAVVVAFPYRRRVAWVLAGGLGVWVAFRLGGFDWWEGYRAVRGRYLAGYGGSRPYAYWAWADFAALAVAAGPAVVAGLRRAVVTQTRASASVPASAPAPTRTRTQSLPPPRTSAVASGLALAALAAVVMAAVSGMSKGEVERIWLPWTVWLPVACAALPARHTRAWLAAQLATALLVQHLLRTPW